MVLTITTTSYNQRRYGRPWIARVDFSGNAESFDFGRSIGQHGEPHTLEINVNPGDIVARGQKDHRQPRNSAPDWFVVNSDGTLTPLASKSAAYNVFRSMRGQIA